jgi:hypothetical protein
MEDFKLSEHFSFFELTPTRNAALQEENRTEAIKYLPTGKALAATILEPIRGDKPLVVNSAFRCWKLNTVTPGSSSTSQHPLFQAGDIHRPGQSATELFEEIIHKFKSEKIPFGQLILEKALRGFVVSEWVHVSLGAAYWKPDRCGEVLKIEIDKNGAQSRALVMKIPQEVT